MIEKNVAINMLEDIEQCLYSDDWKHRTLSTVKQYKKGLLIATDTELKALIDEHKRYDENSTEAIELANKINDKLSQIYNSKC